MVLPLVFALVMLLWATGAWADPYEDCFQSADLERKIRGCTQVIERGKRESRENRATAYTNRGLAYYDKGEVERAIADFDKAIALNPKDAIAYTNRGLAYSEKGDYDSAIADYDKAIVLDPKLALAYTARGLAYEKKGEYDKAIADYTQAIADYRKTLEIDPSDQNAKNNLKRLGVTP